MDQLPSLVAERGPVLASVVFVLSGVFLLSTFGPFKSNAAKKIPLVGEEIGNEEKRRQAYISDASSLYKKGYEIFKNSAFRLTDTDGEKIVLPRHLVEEARHLPDDYVNFVKAFENQNEKRYTKLGSNRAHSDFVNHLVRGDLTRSLNRINNQIATEVEATVVDELGPCKDWTSVAAFQKVLRIVAIVSGSVFIGPELCRREEYVHSSINYTVDMFTSIGKLKQWQKWLRPIGQYFVPELAAVAEHRTKAKNFLGPVIKERRQLMKQDAQLPDDMLQWMLNRSEQFNMPDSELSQIQLDLSLAAIHTTTMTTMMILYDLVVRPDIIEELRKEIKAVLAANNGNMSTRALFEMKLLDSVMKESQRTNPGNLVRFVRYIDKPVTLSDGTYLPQASLIESAHAAIVQDPQLYSNPETFDAHRFVDLRSGTASDPLEYKNKEQYQFVTVTKDFMAFGYGRHACPGRFFAANEIKLILIRILLNYDIKMPDGITERYANLKMGLDALPDPTKSIMFRAVQSAS